MFKRIYATVTEKEFDTFRNQCYLNMVKMGDCLATLIRNYIEANKEFVKEEHHEGTGADYGKEHSK